MRRDDKKLRYYFLRIFHENNNYYFIIIVNRIFWKIFVIARYYIISIGRKIYILENVSDFLFIYFYLFLSNFLSNILILSLIRTNPSEFRDDFETIFFRNIPRITFLPISEINFLVSIILTTLLLFITVAYVFRCRKRVEFFSITRLVKIRR